MNTSAFSQTVSFTGKGVTLEKVFSEIKQQTGYLVVLNYDLLQQAKPVTIQAENQPLRAFMDVLLKDQQLDYSIKNKTITIRRKLTGFTAEDSHAVTGIITDSSGKPLAGATVRVKGTSLLRHSDHSGHFTVAAITGDYLVISYIGYEPYETKVTEQEDFHVFLKQQVTVMQDVAVQNVSTGYQRIPKERATGSFSMIGGKALERRTAPNLLTLMEGMAPGLVLQYTANGLEDSKDPAVMIRGVSTFGSTQPLIVVDGFPIEGNISSVNPNDVAHITILKDAAAASIWGVKASNGVIVIETKKGSTVAPVVTYRSYYTMNRKPSLKYMNLSTSADMIDLEKEIFDRSGVDRSYYQLLGEQYSPVYAILMDHQENIITDAERDKRLAALAGYDNREDGAQEFFANNHLLSNNISFSGAPQSNFNYYASFGYINGSGLYKGSKQRQANANFNAEIKLNPKLKLSMGLNYTEDNSAISPVGHFSDIGDRIPYSLMLLPYERLRNADGTAAAVTRKFNKERNTEFMNMGFYDISYYPVNDLTDYTLDRKTTNLRLQSFLTYKLNKSLSFQGGYKVERVNSYAGDLYTETGYETRVLLNRFAEDVGGKLKFNLPKGDFLKEQNGRTNNYYIRGQLDLNHQFGGNGGQVVAVIGTEWQKSALQNTTDTRFGYGRSSGLSFPVDQYKLFTFFNDLLGESGSFEFEKYYNKQLLDERYVSYFFNGAYTYLGKYTVSASTRINKSSRFDQSSNLNRNLLSSAGVKWDIRKEPFLRNADWLQQLHLRYTAGLTGNVPNYSSSSLRTSAFIALSGNGSFMLSALNPANKHLKWESSFTHNIGIDFALFRGRIEAVVELYHKKTNNMLAPQIMDPTLVGKYYVYKNVADVTNRGIELQLTTINVKSGSFTWRTMVNASYNANKFNRSDTRRDQAIGFPVSITDYPSGSIFAYRWAGLNNAGVPQLYYEKDGKDEVTTTTNTLLFKDFKHVGTITPKYSGSVMNLLNYKHWELSFLFIGNGGHVLHTDYYREQNTYYADGDAVFRNLPAAIKDRWRTPGDEARTNVPGYGNGAYSYNSADILYQSAAFMKLRETAVSYLFNKSNFRKLPVSDVKLNFQARNIWKWVANDAGIDPEAHIAATGMRTLPVTASYTVGILANF